MIKQIMLLSIICLFASTTVFAEFAPQFNKGAKDKTDMSSSAPNYGKVFKKDEVIERGVNKNGEVMESNVNKPEQAMESNMIKPEKVMKNNLNKGKQVME